MINQTPLVERREIEANEVHPVIVVEINDGTGRLFRSAIVIELTRNENTNFVVYVQSVMFVEHAWRVRISSRPSALPSNVQSQVLNLPEVGAVVVGPVNIDVTW